MFSRGIRARGGLLSLTILVAMAPVAAVACGDAGTATDPNGAITPSDPSSTSTAKPSSPDAGDTSANHDAQADAPVSTGPDANDPATIASASCKAPLPSNGGRAAALPVYAGTCPVLAASPAYTTITTKGNQRTFMVYKPTTIAPGEKLPVVFLWHWLGGDPDGMASKLEVQTAVDLHRFIGVIPASKSDALFRWPFEATQSQGRVDEEVAFFDDMLACVSAALPVNKECVSSLGVSAGALWTAQLAIARSEHLSSMVSLSGGVDGVVRGWSTTPHRLPALVLWGGDDDVYPKQLPIMNFKNASKALIGDLAKDGHYLVECTHNCGHAVPPFDMPAPPGLQFDTVWRFVLDHPYWLAASKSPYTGKALPAAYPKWCGQGQGSATPRPAGSVCE